MLAHRLRRLTKRQQLRLGPVDVPDVATTTDVDPLADRIDQLMKDNTVAELRAMAEGMGLEIGTRAKEKTIAQKIAQAEATKEAQS